MKRTIITLAIAAVLLAGSNSAWARRLGPTVYSTNMDSVEDLHNWCSIDTTYFNSPPQSLRFNDADGRSGYPTTTLGSFTTVANRSHYITMVLYEPNRALLGVYAMIRNDDTATDYTSSDFDTGGTGYFKGVTRYITPGGTGMFNAKAQLKVNLGSANRDALMDDFRIHRAMADPEVSSTSIAGDLDAGVATTISFYNAGGITADAFDIFFDPDIQATATNATVNSVSWVSDTQVDVNLTALGEGTVDVTLKNPYGDGYFDGDFVDYNTSTTSFTAIPEPATMGLLAMGGLAMLLRRKRN